MDLGVQAGGRAARKSGDQRQLGRTRRISQSVTPHTSAQQRLAVFGVAGVHHAEVGCRKRIGQNRNLHAALAQSLQGLDTRVCGHEMGRDDLQLSGGLPNHIDHADGQGLAGGLVGNHLAQVCHLALRYPTKSTT
jgi:hypothetical protein